MSKDLLTAAYLSTARALVRAILLLVGRLEVRGQENVPPAGPFILVANHLSTIDAPLILAAFPGQQLRVFAGHKWRRHPIIGPLLGLAGAIWVKRGQVDRRALAAAIKALEGGAALGMAPEGTRSRSHVLQRARNGAAFIASRAGVPLLPVGIINTDRFQENLLRLRRSHFQINIGRPFELPDLGTHPDSRRLAAYSELIMAHIACLLPERYHGLYADSPALAALQAGRPAWPAACQAAGIQESADTASPALE